MNRTSADAVIIQALWPGPAPEMFDAIAAVSESAPRAPLFTYASRSFTRCSSDGEAADDGVAFCAGEKFATKKNAPKIKTRTTISIFGSAFNRAADLRSTRKTPPSGVVSEDARRSLSD